MAPPSGKGGGFSLCDSDMEADSDEPLQQVTRPAAQSGQATRRECASCIGYRDVGSGRPSAAATDSMPQSAGSAGPYIPVRVLAPCSCVRLRTQKSFRGSFVLPWCICTMVTVTRGRLLDAMAGTGRPPNAEAFNKTLCTAAV